VIKRQRRAFVAPEQQVNALLFLRLQIRDTSLIVDRDQDEP
jgi:hypothetical protein